jgi:pilus assembly protein CpaE
MRNSRVLVVDVTGDLGQQVDRVTSGLRPRPEVVSCDSLEKAQELIYEQGFELLIAGTLAADAKGLHQLRQLRDGAPDMSLILALDHVRTASVREIVRTGALDLLRLPVRDEALLDAVDLALSQGPISHDTPDKAREAVTKGTVTTVVSATGGCGKTFLAKNLGYYLQGHSEGRTCILDLDLQFGELATALRLKPRYTIADLVTHQADTEDLAPRLEEYLERHESGVFVLASPDQPSQADAIQPDDVARVIDAACARFQNVIVDTSTALSEATLVALDHADHIYVLATLDLPSVRNLGRLLSTFEQLKVPGERAKLVLNKVEPDVGIDLEGMKKYFPQGFNMVIPYGREVNRSLNNGQPVLAYAPHGEVSKALGAGLAAIDATADVQAEPARRRWLGRRQERSA